MVSLEAWLKLFTVALTVACVIHLLLYKREPLSTVAWLLFVIFVPVVGPAFYFLFGQQRLVREATKRKAEISKMLSPEAFLVSQVEQERAETLLPAKDRNVFTLAHQVSEYPMTWGNVVEILPDPSEALAAMEEAIRSAKKFIHLEYYIIASDEVTTQLFGSLVEAKKRGVEVRILYDSLGSLFLKKIYFRKLVQAGIQIAGFLPITSITERFNLNFRNHRKILIVDGTTVFTGGTNIGKEYLGIRTETQWRDQMVRVQGPVCTQLHDVFAKDWQFTTKEDLFEKQYYPAPTEKGDSVIQVLESGPDAAFYTLHQALFLAINSAEKEIYLTTPYFIPSPSILSALTVAALRGVKVKLITPRKSDAPLVQHASRSFYDDLLKAGVEVYEYLPRVLHSKLLVIDKKLTILGSANMDIRSFRLNFELNLMIYGKSFAEEARTLMEVDLGHSEQLSLQEFSKRSVLRQLIENTCRLLSPIL